MILSSLARFRQTHWAVPCSDYGIRRTCSADSPEIRHSWLYFFQSCFSCPHTRGSILDSVHKPPKGMSLTTFRARLCTGGFGMFLVATILLAGAQLGSAKGVPPVPPASAITTAAQIRKMTVQEAQKSYAVRLRGIITYYDPDEPDLFIEDDTSGIWVNIEKGPPNVALKAGDVVELDGITEAPDFAPQIGNPQFKVVGRAALPPAKRVSFEQMASTIEDSQRVEVEGIVRKVFKKRNRLYLDVATEGGRVTGRIPFYTQDSLPRIVDARVRMRGTCGAEFNSANQLTGIYVNIPFESELKVVEAAPIDPFNAPVVAISDLLRFTPEKGTGHSVRVEGVVTLSRPGNAVFIQNAGGSLYVQTQQDTLTIQPGDQVEVGRVSDCWFVCSGATGRDFATNRDGRSSQSYPAVPGAGTARELRER